MYLNSIKNRTLSNVLILTAFLAFIFLNFTASAQAYYEIDAGFQQVKTSDSPVVYYLDHGRGKKKAYVNETSFLAYGNRWSEIKIIHPELLRAWKDVSLVKAHNRPEVFYIENNTKKWIKSGEEFIKNGYEWSEIVSIAQIDLDQYTLIGDSSYQNKILEQPVAENNSAGVLISNQPTPSAPAPAFSPASSGTAGNTSVSDGAQLTLSKTPATLVVSEVKALISAGSNGFLNSGEKNNFAGSFTITNTGDENIRLLDITLLTSGDGFLSSLGYRNLRIKESGFSRNIGSRAHPASGSNKLSLNRYLVEAGTQKTFEVYVDFGEHDRSSRFELRFAELNAKGEKSRINATISGSPTQSIIVDRGGSSLINDRVNEGGSFRIIRPANGRISTFFHDSKYIYQSQIGDHQGIDIDFAQGTPVKAAADGTIFSVFNGGMNSASYVIINHENGYRTIYAHLSVINVRNGDGVKAGDIIGLGGGRPGTPGAGPYSNGPHLHFEIHYNGIPVDPMNYLR